MPDIQSELRSLDDDELQRFQQDPRLYIRNAWNHPADQSNANRTYDFYDADKSTKLQYLLSDNGPLNPEQWGGINILLMARSMLKTTMLQMIVNWAVQFYGPKGFEGYMAAPRQGQTKEFVGKLKEKIEWSGLSKYRVKNAIEHQKFEFNVNGSPVYSHFKSDSGWGEGDSMRGPHSHLGIYDEFQDASRKSFNAGFREVIDQNIRGVPYFPVIFIMGTPKMEGSFFEEMWERSDKREWMPDANNGDGDWVPKSDAVVYGDGDDTMRVRGWHISQEKSPFKRHSRSSIEEKRDMKTEQEFMNEVMARFYSPEDHLLSERHVDNVVNPDVSFVESPRSNDNYVTVGVDWGGGSDRKAADTVITVMEHVQYSDQPTESIVDNVLFLDNELSKEEEFKRLEEQFIRFDPDRVIVDEGYGSKRREDLQHGVHTMNNDGYDSVVGCRFGNISNVSKLKWRDSDVRNLVTADKSHVANSFVDFVKSERLVIPGASFSDASTHTDSDSRGAKLYSQLTAPFEERKETKSGRKKTSVTSKSGMNDDAFDSFVYAWLAFHGNGLGPVSTTRRFSSRNGPGVNSRSGV